MKTSIRFDDLPDDAPVRCGTVSQLFGGRSRASIWRDTKSGRLPKPIKIADKSVGWRVGDIRQALRQLVAEATDQAE